MAKILIVEDEPNMRLGLRDNLEFEQHEVSIAEDGEKGLQLLLSQSFDLAILDVMMPKLSGFDVCKQARQAGINVPIIFLTAKSEELDKVLGLEFGADDYITKPFSLRELLARVKAILRRTQSTAVPQAIQETKNDYVTIGALEVNFEQYDAKSGQESVKMSHKEFEILNYLYQQKNEVVSRYDLLDKVWGYNAHPTTRTVDNFILRLRQKVEPSSREPKIILTVHGVGYKLIQ